MNCDALRKLWLRLLGAAILATLFAPAAAWADGGVAATAAKPAARVEITMHVPAGAHIWFDGEATMQTGTTRVFVSPPLEPERQYVYVVRVRWSVGGDTVERTRRLAVEAGDQISLDFSGRGVVEVMGYSAERPDLVPAARYAPVYRPELSPTESALPADVGGARNGWKPDPSDPFRAQG
jgi:uncharacterized protein (TIGR03000 family)